MNLPIKSQTTAAAFEDEDEPTNATAAQVPAVAAAKPLAVAKPSQLAADFTKAIDSMKDAMSFDYGDFAAFKARTGNISGGSSAAEKTNLGRWVEVEMMSWTRRVEVSPGVSGDSAKNYVAHSHDCKVIDKIIGEDLQEHVGLTVPAYIAVLKEEHGLSKASSREMIDLLVYVHRSEKATKYTGENVVITLPPTSISSFNKYLKSLEATALNLSRGLPVNIPQNPSRFFLSVEAASKGDTDWTKLRITTAMPTDL